jgi:hypothetical protein
MALCPSPAALSLRAREGTALALKLGRPTVSAASAISLPAAPPTRTRGCGGTVRVCAQTSEAESRELTAAKALHKQDPSNLGELFGGDASVRTVGPVESASESVLTGWQGKPRAGQRT